MFDRESMTSDGVCENDALAALREADWKALHHRLRSIARQRVSLEAEEARILVEAEETRLYSRLGYTTMIEYMERELYWGPHAARERLRVAHALLDLPLTAELFRNGAMSFSTVRELTRVATPATEEAFLRKAQGKTAHQVQQMVAGLKPGDEPGDRPDPSLITKRIVIEVSVETYAMWRRTRNALDNESIERLSDDEFLQLLCRRGMESPATTDAVPHPAAQTAVTTCKACKQSFIESPGEAVPIDDATAARLACDSEHIGDLESDECTRVTPTVPASIRRKVFHRDHFSCAVPGCRSTRNLDLHHVVYREHGGDHSMGNLAVLCFGCHQRHHAGHLTITGRAPDQLTFQWQRDADVESAMTGARWEWEPIDAASVCWDGYLVEDIDESPLGRTDRLEMIRRRALALRQDASSVRSE